MTQYAYQGRDRSGEKVSGQLEAASLDAAAEQLASRGITPLDVQPQQAPAERRAPRWQKQPSRADLILFTRQLYTLIRAGVPLIRGLNQLAASTRNPVLVATLQAIIEDLESGRELAGAMARHPRVFRPLYVAIVRVGEQSGRLEEALDQIHRFLDKEYSLRQQIKTATRYPLIVIATMAGAVYFLMTWVIPVFADVFARFDAELPLPTRILIGTSEFFAAYWWLILAGLAGGVLGFRAWARSAAGMLRWDRFKLRLPIFGSILLRGALGQFARALAMSYRAGVPILEAMNVIAAAVDNAWISRQVLAMRDGIQRGEEISRVAARTEVFTPLVLQMLVVGEETGGLDDMADEVAEFYQRELDAEIKNLNTLIEPILTIALAGLVFMLALGIFLPMWELGSTML